jgi:hypothetical protein
VTCETCAALRRQVAEKSKRLEDARINERHQLTSELDAMNANFRAALSQLAEDRQRYDRRIRALESALRQLVCCELPVRQRELNCRLCGARPCADARALLYGEP